MAKLRQPPKTKNAAVTMLTEAKLCLIQLFPEPKTKGRVSEKIYVYGFEKYGRRTKNLTEIDRNS